MQKFTCSPAHMRDLTQIMSVIEDARAFMASYGSPQWQDGFPDSAFVAEKISRGAMYAVRCCGRIAGVFSVVGDEPDYRVIDGAWLTEDNYLAVHTVAVTGAFRGCGCAKFIFSNVFAMAEERGRGSVRIDTHEMNAPMRSLLAALGFSYCGTITLASGGGRMAFEKLI